MKAVDSWTAGLATPERGTDRPSVGSRFGRAALVVIVLLCGLTLAVGYANKARCTGPQYDSHGRSTPDYDLRRYRDVCYSDIQHLWLTRHLFEHKVPYFSGELRQLNSAEFEGGTVEYPVLTGLVIWAAAGFADTDGGFLLSCALLMAPFGLLIAWMLGRMSRWRSLLWAIGPPLVLFGYLNWDLPVVACAVAAFYLLQCGWGRTGSARPLLHRALAAAVLLGLGVSFKLYPGLFVPPLMLYVFCGGLGGREGKQRNWLGALWVGAAAGFTVLLTNLPFILFAYRGWRASLAFQQSRTVDETTNSFWYWAFRPWSNPENASFQNAVSTWSPVLVLTACAVALWVGWRLFLRTGTYPVVAVSAAMLCAFMVLHKVDSPQYTLWLLPFLAMLRVRWTWITAFLVSDAVLGISVFRWYYKLVNGLPSDISSGITAQAMIVGVWSRVFLIGALFVVFLRSEQAAGWRPDPVPASPAR